VARRAFIKLRDGELEEQGTSVLSGVELHPALKSCCTDERQAPSFSADSFSNAVNAVNSSITGHEVSSIEILAPGSAGGPDGPGHSISWITGGGLEVGGGGGVTLFPPFDQVCQQLTNLVKEGKE